MKVLKGKSTFCCAVLDSQAPEDLDIFIAGRKCLYEDPLNQDVEYTKESILQALEQNGAEFFQDRFEHENSHHFVLFDGDKVIGSAILDKESSGYNFNGLHVSSDYAGQHLSDLLYQSVAAFVKDKQQKSRIELSTDFDNVASQKAAIRNGYKPLDHQDATQKYYEQVFDFG